MTEKRKLSSAHFNIEGEILGRTYPAISRHHTFLNVVPLGFQARLQSKSEERNPGYEGHQRFTLLRCSFLLDVRDDLPLAVPIPVEVWKISVIDGHVEVPTVIEAPQQRDEELW